VFPILKYPTFNIRLKQDDKQRLFVFDDIRKKWLNLTPEEWVRQHVVNYLITVKQYPLAYISLEKEIELNGTKKRYDIVVYNKAMKPLIIVECKAPEIALSEQVLEQALRYNLVLNVQYVFITNGLTDAVFHLTELLTELPAYNELLNTQ
jgi:type I site-specific restriction endonuclease